MEQVKFSKHPRLKKPILIAAWPGMGEVSFKAAAYLVEKLRAEEFAQLNARNFFYSTSSAVKDGLLSIPELPQNKFYYWKNPAGKRGGRSASHDLIIFLSNAQPDLTHTEAYVRVITSLARDFNVEKVVGFAAMPQPIDHLHPAKVWFTATSGQLKGELKKYEMNLLSEGQISGMNGLFLGMAKKEGLDGFCLLGEIPLYTIQIENPKAAQAVLEALGRILGINLDLTALGEQAQTMEGEINKLLDFLKVGTPEHWEAPIGEEEIEKIKKSLGQLTRLPLSVKEKIEKLFKQAQQDISAAKELKKELDKWNVYKEYEDQFLDLFKKGKEENN